MYPRGKVLLYISREERIRKNVIIIKEETGKEENRRSISAANDIPRGNGGGFYGSGGGEILFATSRSIERKRRIRRGKDREFHSLEISPRTYIYIYVYI